MPKVTAPVPLTHDGSIANMLFVVLFQIEAERLTDHS
jgi:hypothetical protein